MREKLCPECGSPMFINEWEGWIWECAFCDKQGKRATKKEIRELESERKEPDHG